MCLNVINMTEFVWLGLPSISGHEDSNFAVLI